MKNALRNFFALLVISFVAGCGGGGGDTTTTPTTPVTPVTPVTPTLVSLAVTPVDATIAFGATQQFAVAGTYSDGAITDLTKTAKWTSSGAAVTVVATTGLASGVAAGTETVTATVGTVTGSTKLTIKAAFTAVAPGGYHTVALKIDGSLFAWGKNLAGQLGDGTNIDKATPVQAGTVKTWVKVAAGEFHSLAIRADGTLWAWGSNLFGQLGDGTFVNKSAPTKIGTATTWVAVSAGKSHTVALKKDGTLWAWGSNASGELGNGTVDPSNVPVQVGVAKNYFTNWTAVSAGGVHNVARRADGTIWSWGDNTKGQLGRVVLTDTTDVAYQSPILPALVGGDVSNRWVSVTAGSEHSLAVRSDGALFAWGANGFSQLGVELASVSDVGIPTQVGVDTHWAVVTAGGNHNLAIKTDGSLWAWGSNRKGQLGDGTLLDRSPPLQIGTETSWLSIAPGAEHSFAFKADNTLWGWGRNQEGQLGNGSATTEPVLLPTNLP